MVQTAKERGCGHRRDRCRRHRRREQGVDGSKRQDKYGPDDDGGIRKARVGRFNFARWAKRITVGRIHWQLMYDAAERGDRREMEFLKAEGIIYGIYLTRDF